jgi:hypothetical protein
MWYMGDSYLREYFWSSNMSDYSNIDHEWVKWTIYKIGDSYAKRFKILSGDTVSKSLKNHDH